MCDRALPILFINLGGEMMYIIDQRLKAQEIMDEKSQKVLHDIVNTMLNRKFMEELFKPQPLYSPRGLRIVFDRLAHASIMKLNASSMDKLYDLMTMVFKYQLLQCSHPYDLLRITMNHLDGIRSYVCHPTTLYLVDSFYSLLMNNYHQLPDGVLQDVRYTLLQFLQDLNVRVSIFLKENLQTPSGKFLIRSDGPVPWGSDPPGGIKYFGSNNEVIGTSTFEPGEKYGSAVPRGSLNPSTQREPKLGLNIYTNHSVFDVKAPDFGQESVNTRSSEATPPEENEAEPNLGATEELNLLAQLIGRSTQNKEMKLTLVKNDYCASDDTLELSIEQLEIDARRESRTERLRDIIKEFNPEEESQNVEENLLDLMDTLS